MNWQSGDVCRLRSGGPAMVVETVRAPDHQGRVLLECVWSDYHGWVSRDAVPEYAVEKAKAHVEDEG